VVNPVSRKAPAAGDCYKPRTEPIVLHRWQSLTCWGPNAASWWADLNCPTARAGWLTGGWPSEPQGANRGRLL